MGTGMGIEGFILLVVMTQPAVHSRQFSRKGATSVPASSNLSSSTQYWLWVHILIPSYLNTSPTPYWLWVHILIPSYLNTSPTQYRLWVHILIPSYLNTSPTQYQLLVITLIPSYLDTLPHITGCN